MDVEALRRQQSVGVLYARDGRRGSTLSSFSRRSISGSGSGSSERRARRDSIQQRTRTAHHNPPPSSTPSSFTPRSKIVRKGIARVLTVYRANLRNALKSKIDEDGKNKKGKVRRWLDLRGATWRDLREGVICGGGGVARG
jgi:hypothetical protein